MCNYLQTRVRSAVDRLLVPAVQAGGQDRQPRETALRPWSHLIQGLLEGRYINLYISSFFSHAPFLLIIPSFFHDIYPSIYPSFYSQDSTYKSNYVLPYLTLSASKIMYVDNILIFEPTMTCFVFLFSTLA